MNLQDMLNEINNAELPDKSPDPNPPMRKSQALPRRYYIAKYSSACHKCGWDIKPGTTVAVIVSGGVEGHCHSWHWKYIPKDERKPRSRVVARHWHRGERRSF